MNDSWTGNWCPFGRIGRNDVWEPKTETKAYYEKVVRGNRQAYGNG